MISWWFLLRYDGGLMNYILVKLGFEKSYLSSAETAIPSLVLIAVWTSGNLIVIFWRAAERAGVSRGCGNRRRKRLAAVLEDHHSCAPIIFYNLLMSLVINLRVVGTLCRHKGRPGKSTIFMAYLMYQIGFRGRELGSRRHCVCVFIVAAILAFYTVRDV